MEISKKNVGLIECGNATIPSLSNDFSPSNGFRVTKILAKNIIADQYVREYYPNAELVADSGSIMNDASIELVIVSTPDSNDLTLVAEALGAGKQVRVL
jgi:scyllo-inositol 2-dehydrogenase (NADP+)